MDRESGVTAGGRLLLPLLAAALLVCASCASVGGSAGNGESLRTLKRGSMNIPKGDRVIRSSEELAALWGQNRLKGEVPEVDFSESMVLVVSRGCLSNACFATVIVSFNRTGTGGDAWVEDADPNPICVCASTLTCPYHIAVVPRVEGEVDFRHRTVRADCHERWRP